MLEESTSWVVPFSFLSGVGLMILSTGNRFHHVNDLIRGFSTKKPENAEQKAYLHDLLSRSYLLHHALATLYGAMAFFALSALVGLLQSRWSWALALGEALADILTTLGVAGVVICSCLLIIESAICSRIVRYYDRLTDS